MAVKFLPAETGVESRFHVLVKSSSFVPPLWYTSALVIITTCFGNRQSINYVIYNHVPSTCLQYSLLCLVCIVRTQRDQTVLNLLP